MSTRDASLPPTAATAPAPRHRPRLRHGAAGAPGPRSPKGTLGSPTNAGPPGLGKAFSCWFQRGAGRGREKHPAEPIAAPHGLRRTEPAAPASTRSRSVTARLAGPRTGLVVGPGAGPVEEGPLRSFPQRPSEQRTAYGWVHPAATRALRPRPSRGRCGASQGRRRTDRKRPRQDGLRPSSREAGPRRPRRHLPCSSPHVAQSRRETPLTGRAAPLSHVGRRGRPGSAVTITVPPARSARRQVCWVTCLRAPGCDWPVLW